MPPTAAAYKRYLEKFDEQETEIEKLQAKIKKLQAAEHQQRRSSRTSSPTSTSSDRAGLAVCAPGKHVLPGPPGRQDTGTALPELPRLCQFPSPPTCKPQLAEICTYPVIGKLRQSGRIGGDPCNIGKDRISANSLPRISHRAEPGRSRD